MSEIQDAITAMSRATGVKELIDAHQKAKRAVRGARRTANAESGSLGTIFTVAMRLWDEQKAAGATLAERLRNLGQTLRAAWPQTREWKTLCENCDDHGLAMGFCPGDATCGRRKQHLPHEFGTPCWCELGRKFRDKPKPNKDDFAAAGQSKPMARLGR